MVLGAALWASTGTDIDRALMSDDLGAYLAASAPQRAVLVSNLCVWIVGALTLGAAGQLLAPGPRPTHVVARYVYGLGATSAVVAFVAWLAVIVQSADAPSPTAVEIARIVGWFAYRLDVVATALLIGIAPAILALAPSSLPSWLRRWALAAGAVALASFLPYLTGAPLELAFLIVPVGMSWTIAAGVTVLRRTPAAPGEGPVPATAAVPR
jgi:hypothetical protein